MDIQEFVSTIRDHYVQQFKIFVSTLSAESKKGSAEVKLLIPHRATPFDQNYCADFVKNDDGASVIEMIPDQILTFTQMEGCIGEVEVNFDSMCWDGMTFEHDAPKELQGPLEDWFNRWYDRNESEAPQSDGLSGRVHCLSVHDRSVNVDFGTSSPEAFWELFSVLVDRGAKTVRISTSRTVQT
jgi:hypothetical protein